MSEQTGQGAFAGSHLAAELGERAAHREITLDQFAGAPESVVPGRGQSQWLFGTAGDAVEQHPAQPVEFAGGELAGIGAGDEQLTQERVDGDHDRRAVLRQ
ncbi:hypothetical protein GCM10027167_60200 [Nocardia heshunensis]